MEGVRHILFLCTGNSCRSQMCEGFARAIGEDRFTVSSAGMEAHGKNPRAIRVMSEVGIDISGQESTELNEAMLEEADLVVTVCGDADEKCPVLPSGTRKIHWPIEDPAAATGTEEEVLEVFRAAREDILGRVRDLLDGL